MICNIFYFVLNIVIDLVIVDIILAQPYTFKPRMLKGGINYPHTTIFAAIS